MYWQATSTLQAGLPDLNPTYDTYQLCFLISLCISLLISKMGIIVSTHAKVYGQT